MTRKKNQQPPEVEVKGPGFCRMKARLGPERMEEMCRRTLQDQDEALANAAASRPQLARSADRDAYRDYPRLAAGARVRHGDTIGTVLSAGPEQSAVRWDGEKQEVIVPNDWLEPTPPPRARSRRQV